MSRVTEFFDLGMSQGSVDFVDVNVHGDVPVYIDPTAIRIQSGPWAEECVALLQSFFERLLIAIRADDATALRALVYPLVEPNETHLGISTGRSRGRSLGSRAKADELISSLSKSRAVASGFLQDLEDSALMVEGVDKDIVSDIATCVIRSQLISYTQEQCVFHRIPMESQDSGPAWDGQAEQWVSGQVKLPRADEDKLLLVPKSIVRVRLSIDKGRYYRGYLRPYFEEEALSNPNTGLVRVLADKRRKVFLKALDAELGTTKPDIIRNTEKYPEALKRYKDSLPEANRGPLPEQELALQVGAEVENLRQLHEEVGAIVPGPAGATLYHRGIARLLSVLFTGALGNQKIEAPLHGDLKRIDILYDNVARFGFFQWLGSNFSASMVVVECKNYGKDAANPEFDQLAMRFSNDRGRFGILACRSFQDKERALLRAKKSAVDGHGYVIVLDDEDLGCMIEDFEAAGLDVEERLKYPLLRERFRALVGA